MARPPATTPPRRATTAVTPLLVRAGGGPPASKPDRVVTEEPLQILAGGPGQDSVAVAVTMRTPGHDFELTVGFLFGEGLISGRAAVREVKYCEVPEDQPQLYNVVTARTADPIVLDPAAARRFTMTSACGLCGTASLEAVEKQCAILDPAAGPVMAVDTVVGLPARLREGQGNFAATGGLHGVALFDASGTPLVTREDVGRHNAVDKVVGWAVMGGRVPLRGVVMCVSGRVSFEIVQKAAMAGIGLLVAVSAPSSLAVQAADRLGVTLVGFVRDGTGNIYTHPERVVTGSAPTSRP